MASGPITSWQIDGETMRDFILGGSKITADGDCSHEITRCLLFGRKIVTKLDGILKSRDITLPITVHLVKAMVFPVVMYGYESWTIKKVECWRIDTFELLFGEDSWESLGLQGDPTSPSPKKSILNIHWKDWCWSWNANSLATWCEELNHWKNPWWWENLKAGEGNDRRGDCWMASQTWVWVNSGSWWWTRRCGVLQSIGSQRVGHDWATNWTNWSNIGLSHIPRNSLSRFPGLLLLRVFLSRILPYRIKPPHWFWK